MTIRKRFKMHGRLQGGSMYVYDLFDDETGETIATLTSVSKRKITTEVIVMGGTEFSDRAEFLEAYAKLKEQRRRDSEWESAAPKGGA